MERLTKENRETIAKAIEALKTPAVFEVQFIVDGLAVRLVGHPSNAFPCSVIELDPHMAWAKRYPAQSKTWSDLVSEVEKLITEMRADAG